MKPLHSEEITSHRLSRLRVRPKFLLACAIVLIVVFLPEAISGRRLLRQTFLLAAAVAIILGWFFFLKNSKPSSGWRAFIAVVTSVYLTASLPVFLFESAQIKWLMGHPLREQYVHLWVHDGSQGFLQTLLAVVGSFFGTGRARVAFVTGSILLLILRLSMGTWVY